MAKAPKKQDRFLLLHDIRSTHNVGSIFRTADAAGITKIFLSGYTPKPVDRFGRPVKELSKVALGGELSVNWEEAYDPVTVIENLRIAHKNLNVIAIEQDKRALDYKDVKIKSNQPVLFIVGNEVEGVSKEILKRCDMIAEIPMKGKKESLNVGVSVGIALYRILNI